MPFVKVCPVCGVTFSAPIRAAIFCGRECFHESRRKTRHLRTCEQCGQPLKGAQLKSGRRFCCRACYEESRQVKMITKHCPVCDKDFVVPLATASRYTVCSYACRTVETKYIVCERCGKLFRAEKHIDRHYCSEKCRRPARMTACRHCGKDFRTGPSSNRQFCSIACYRRFTGENNIEKQARQALQALGIAFIQEHRVGRYSVDFMLPHHQIALEIDGTYWHQDKRRDARKDAFLRKYNLRVVRITDAEIEKSNNLPALILQRIRLCLAESNTDSAGGPGDLLYPVQIPLPMEPFSLREENK